MTMIIAFKISQEFVLALSGKIGGTDDQMNGGVR